MKHRIGMETKIYKPKQISGNTEDRSTFPCCPNCGKPVNYLIRRNKNEILMEEY